MGDLAFKDVGRVDVGCEGGEDGEEVVEALQDDVAGVGGVEGLGGPLGGKAAVLEDGVDEVDALVEDGILVVWCPEEDHREPAAAVEEAIDVVVGGEPFGAEEGSAVLVVCRALRIEEE